MILFYALPQDHIRGDLKGSTFSCFTFVYNTEILYLYVFDILYISLHRVIREDEVVRDLSVSGVSAFRP